MTDHSLDTFVFEHETYIKLYFPDFMLNSKLIEKHVKNGDVFAANLRTGRVRLFAKIVMSHIEYSIGALK